MPVKDEEEEEEEDDDDDDDDHDEEKGITNVSVDTNVSEGLPASISTAL
jgi:hypothetical protein